MKLLLLMQRKKTVAAASGALIASTLGGQGRYPTKRREVGEGPGTEHII